MNIDEYIEKIKEKANRLNQEASEVDSLVKYVEKALVESRINGYTKVQIKESDFPVYLCFGEISDGLHIYIEYSENSNTVSLPWNEAKRDIRLQASKYIESLLMAILEK